VSRDHRFAQAGEMATHSEKTETDVVPRIAERQGRGALSNPDGRFETQTRCDIDDGWGGADASPDTIRTSVTIESPRHIISRNDSPDIPFDQSINPYRGCEHGCVYCYARPSHGYVGLSAGLDFESRLFAKPDAAALLRRELAAPRYRVSPIALGSNTDPYQPIERRYRITREILEVLAAHRHPVTIVTKSALVERDLDLLTELAQDNLVAVFVSITTLDRQMARRLEPRAAAPARRMETVARLAQAAIPVGVMVAPIIPALNDAEMDTILQEAAKAGASTAGYILLRLPHEVALLFRQWLETHFPDRAAHVMSLVRQSRGGRDNDPAFGARMRGQGPYATMLAQRFRLATRRLGLNTREIDLDRTRFRVPGAQLDMFEAP